MRGRSLAAILFLSALWWLESPVLSVSQQPSLPPRDGTAAAPEPVATGRIRGRVIAADTRAPLAWATVMFSAVDGRPRGGSAQTDARGTFELTISSPGEYRVTAMPPAHRARYLPAHFGAITPYESGIAVRVTAGEVVERIEIALPVAAALAGRVVDEAGEPLADIRVELLRTADPSSSLEPVPAGRSRTVYTDDTGRFRLFAVAEGEYLLAALAERPYQRTSSSPPTFVTTFYPSTLDQTQSQRIAVKAGQETDGLEIRMVRSRTFGISGSVATSDGRPVANTSVSLNRYDRFGGGGEELRLDSEGRFSTGGLTPGDYAIVAGPGRGTLNEFASVPVTIVDSDVDDIVVVTRPTVTVNGRVAFDESMPTAERSKVRLEVTAIDPRGKAQWIPRTVEVSADGAFTIANLFMPVIIRQAGQREWRLKGVFLDRADITDRPTEFQPRDSGHLEVLLTAKLSRIEGRVREERDKPITDCAVLLFSSTPADWIPSSSRIKVTQLQGGGEFSFPDVRPGSYRIIAIPQARLTGGSPHRPAFLEALITDATDVTVGEDERRTVDLRLVTR
jgi:Carboxypeptidase regulatory-like domain